MELEVQLVDYSNDSLFEVDILCVPLSSVSFDKQHIGLLGGFLPKLNSCWQTMDKGDRVGVEVSSKSTKCQVRSGVNTSQKCSLDGNPMDNLYVDAVKKIYEVGFPTTKASFKTDIPIKIHPSKSFIGPMTVTPNQASNLNGVEARETLKVGKHHTIDPFKEGIHS
jgi:hypothetical protein